MVHAPFAEWLHRPVDVLLHNTISTIPSGGKTALDILCYEFLKREIDQSQISYLGSRTCCDDARLREFWVNVNDRRAQTTIL
jgi:hypothetical protein